MGPLLCFMVACLSLLHHLVEDSVHCRENRVLNLIGADQGVEGLAQPQVLKLGEGGVGRGGKERKGRRGTGSEGERGGGRGWEKQYTYGLRQ